MDDLIVSAACDGPRSRAGDAALGRYTAAHAAGAAVLQVATDEVAAALRAGTPDALVVGGAELAGLPVEPIDLHCGTDDDVYELFRRDVLRERAQALLDAGVKPVSETFTTGGAWNMQLLIDEGLLPAPRAVTLVLGRPGGTWTPPTLDALELRVRSLPPGCVWTLAVQDPEAAWKLLPVAIAMGGHVRVGSEDNPYLPTGARAAHDGELVDVVVAAAGQLGRSVATPSSARRILGIAEPA